MHRFQTWSEPWVASMPWGRWVGLIQECSESLVRYGLLTVSTGAVELCPGHVMWASF